jgi:carbon monoxide dehydrogenase subunit G
VQLEHSFTVPVGIDDAWRHLLDIDLIAPCMPGAAIDSVYGDDFTGTVQVKLGPIGLTYKGKASFVEKDETAHRAVIDARGRDSRGSGTANAKITATLTESGGSTRVDVLTDLDITGKPAQFGRGMMVDVGNKLIGQFAECLAGKLTDGATPDAPAITSPVSPTSSMENAVSDETPTAPKSRPRPRPRKATAESPAGSAAVPASASRKSSGAKSAAAKTAAPKPAKAAPAEALPAEAPGAAPTTAAAAVAPTAASAAELQPNAPTALEPGGAEPAVPQPAEAEKASAVASLPKHTAAAPRRTAEEVEPINLIESAGPALAKRLAPLVALLVVLVLIAIARRRRH